MNAEARTESRPELLIRRTFDAPRRLVFEAWTDGEHLKNWCCPTGFSIVHSSSDIRVGGRFRTCMRSPEGEDFCVAGTYTEIVPVERVAFTHAWEGEDGRPGHETLVTITLADTGDGGTRLTLHQAFFLSEESRDGHTGGWNQTLDSLEEYLSK